MRLQPIWKSGVTALRRPGSEMPRSMFFRASFLAGAASFGLTVKPGHEALAAPVDAGAVGLLDERQVAEREPLDRRVVAGRLRGITHGAVRW